MRIKRLHLTAARWQDGRAAAGEAQRSADQKGGDIAVEER
jgi:hypothetical protein